MTSLAKSKKTALRKTRVTKAKGQKTAKADKQRGQWQKRRVIKKIHLCRLVIGLGPLGARLVRGPRMFLTRLGALDPKKKKDPNREMGLALGKTSVYRA
jgi:hypothetical protein